MLKFERSTKSLVPVVTRTLAESQLLERTDLQASIINSWESFSSELGYSELFLVGSEIEPHDACRNRIDILALSRDGNPVVFELKRHRDRLQLLQAITYAAMISKWDARRFSTALGTRSDEGAMELRSLLSDPAFKIGAPEIVLMAESFDPEVILAAEWLDSFNISLSAFSISGVEHQEDTLISIDQRFPLARIDDLYVRRAGLPL